jgi:hypothetical protein
MYTIPEVKFRRKDFIKSKVSLLAISCEDWFRRSTKESASGPKILWRKYQIILLFTSSHSWSTEIKNIG